MSSFAAKNNSARNWRMRFDLTTFLTLAPDQASFDVRGFCPGSAGAVEALESIGETFIAGYNAAVRADTLMEVVQVVADVPPQLRGFAVEGAAMGTTISDALPCRPQRFPHLIELFDTQFTYLVHVGAGWGLARVPWRKRHIFEHLDPLHRWLAFDGLGFHDGYFKPSKILSGWRRKYCGYEARAYDQGVGRALWFVGGGSVHRAADRIRELQADRQGDLFSGLGLAVAYAGPATSDDVRHAIELAGRECTHLAQGIAFACEARARASFVPQHTHAAAQTLGFEASVLATLVRDARKDLSEQDKDPPYEAWRRTVAGAMTPFKGGRE